MRRLFTAWSVILSTLILACGLCGEDFKFETKQVKERQKTEIKALKVKHKYSKAMLKRQSIPKSMRTQMLNEMKREEKSLRQKHEAELETLKDRQRVLKEMQGG
jgi:hypothetical protein